MKLRLILSIFLLLVLVKDVYSVGISPGKILIDFKPNLEQAITMAKKNNLDLKIADKEVEKQRFSSGKSSIHQRCKITNLLRNLVYENGKCGCNTYLCAHRERQRDSHTVYKIMQTVPQKD